MNHDNSRCDVIVAGGGPAGSTAATILSQYGYRVMLFEKEIHPRFHIGESMLPFSEPVLKRLGVDWSQYGIAKAGAEFIDEATNNHMFFQLSDQFQAYQIERSEFDAALFENAKKQGVETHQNTTVAKIDINDTGVNVTANNEICDARYFIDATGRNAVMGRRNRTIKRLDNLGKFALYTHYSQINNQTAKKLFETGNIVVPVVENGWLWIIPLAGHKISVGLVISNRGLEGESTTALFQRYIQQSDYLKELLDGATQDWPVRSEANFSYINQQKFGERFACCGDAAGFLDPVFSSGVFLALTGAERVADRVHQGLVDNSEADPNLHAIDDTNYDLSFSTMQVFIERFYHTDLVHNVFFEAGRDLSIKNNISELLAGNMWSGTNRWQQGLLKSRYRR